MTIFTRTSYEADTYKATATCPFCGKESEVPGIPGTNLFKYNQGAFVQDAFPMLSAEERELILTGVCSTCWDSSIPGEEE